MKQSQVVQDMEKMTFNIVEMFSSLSGEGSTCGMPASFVRVAGCNLRCDYCDTKYSYNDEFKTLGLDEIVATLKSFKNKTVVCTGGEPLLNKNNARQLPLLLTKEGFEVYIETNGATPLYNYDELKSCDRKKLHYVVDIKTPISKMYKFDMLETNCLWLQDGDEIKCVVGSMDDVEFCRKKITSVYKKIKDKKINIIFSPVFGKIPLDDLAKMVIDFKDVTNSSMLTVKLGIQLHKLIWPNIEKGV